MAVVLWQQYEYYYYYYYYYYIYSFIYLSFSLSISPFLYCNVVVLYARDCSGAYLQCVGRILSVYNSNGRTLIEATCVL